MTSLWGHDDVIGTPRDSGHLLLLKSVNLFVSDVWPLIFQVFEQMSSFFTIENQLGFDEVFISKKIKNVDQKDEIYWRQQFLWRHKSLESFQKYNT